MKDLFKNKWFKRIITVFACVIVVYGLIYVDLVLRARTAYMQGEKYFTWYKNPSLKKEALLKDLMGAKKTLDNELKKGKITKEEYEQQLEIADFDHKNKLKESSIKYAYIWYQTAVELFSPPESKWVKLSRGKMVQSKELWKRELTSKNIPFEDYMLE